MITEIKNAIKNKLESVTRLRHVYTYTTGTPEGFPYATITSDSFEGEFADYSAVSKRNRRTFRFNLDVFVEKDEASFGSEKAERIIDETVSEIISAFDMDTTLSGVVEFVRVMGGDLGYSQQGNIIRIAELNIECIKLTNSR